MNGERAQRGSHILATLTKYWEATAGDVLNAFELDDFPAGQDVELGLADDYAVMVEPETPHVEGSIWSKVVRLCSSLRRHAEASEDETNGTLDN